MSEKQFCHFALETQLGVFSVFSLQVTSSKIDIGPYKIVALSSEGEGGLLCLQSADFAHGGNQTSSLQFRVLNMPVLKFNASQCYPNADKEDSGKIQNSRCRGQV